MTPIGSPVRAQIGLVLRLRNSLSQMSTRIVVLTGAGIPARSKAAATLSIRRDTVPSGSPRVNLLRVPGELRMTPGSTTSFIELMTQPMTRSSPIARSKTPPGSSSDRSGRGTPVSGQR